MNRKSSSLIAKIFFSLIFPLFLFCFFAPITTLAQCSPPEANVLLGSCNDCFIAIVQVRDPNDPIHGVLTLEASSFRGDGGSGGIPFSGVPSSVVGTATFTVNVGNINNFGGVFISVTNSCCETTMVILVNFSRPAERNASSVKYVGNTCNTPGIQTVVFKAFPNNDALTDNHHPETGGFTQPGATIGKRIFPDKNSPNDPQVANRKKARIIAHTSGIPTGTPIYFKSYDVDDPYLNVFVDTNGIVGNDNRGTPKVGTLNKISDSGAPISKCPDVDGGCWAQTNSSGDAVVELTVTMHPGDNFVVAANTNPIKFAADANGTPQETDGTKVSEMLTVWRRLHIEADKMETDVIKGNKVTGTIKGIKLDQKDGTTEFELDMGPTKKLEKDRYAPGILLIEVPNGNQTTNFLKIVFGNQNDKITTIGLVRQSDIDLFIGKSFTLYDDDDYDASGDSKGDEGEEFNIPSDAYDLIQDSDDPSKNILAAAYIQPKFDGGGSPSNGSHPFEINLEFLDDSISQKSIDLARNSTANESDDFWVAYLLFIYQGDASKDGDPLTERVTTGTTLSAAKDDASKEEDVASGGNGSHIALESAADSQDNFGRDKHPDHVKIIVPHELGHQLGLKGHEDEFKIMAVTVQAALESGTTFAPRHINTLRWRVKSPQLPSKK